MAEDTPPDPVNESLARSKQRVSGAFFALAFIFLILAIVAGVVGLETGKGQMWILGGASAVGFVICGICAAIFRAKRS